MKYLTINWKEVNKAIKGGQLSDLRKVQNEIEKKIQNKVDAFYKAKRSAEFATKIKALRDLPAGAELYYIGYSSDIPFGAKGEKEFTARNGFKRMSVSFNGKGWNCYYKNLQIDPPTESQISSNDITKRLSPIVNKVFNQS